MKENSEKIFHTASGLRVLRKQTILEYRDSMAGIITELDDFQGVLLSSSFEFPGRYTRWDVGFVRPPVKIVSRGRRLEMIALNRRGALLIGLMRDHLKQCDALATLEVRRDGLSMELKPPENLVFEEQRSRRHSVFSILRHISDYFRLDEEILWNASREDIPPLIAALEKLS